MQAYNSFSVLARIGSATALQSMKQRLQQSALVTAAEIRKEKQPLLPSYSDVEKKELEEEGFKVVSRKQSKKEEIFTSQPRCLEGTIPAIPARNGAKARKYRGCMPGWLVQLMRKLQEAFRT